MNWFKNLKISKKLLIGFILVSLIAGLEGYEGMSSLKKADDSDEILYKYNTVPLSYLIELTGNFHRMRANGLELMAAKTPEEHETAYSSLLERSAGITKNLAAIKELIIADEVRQKVEGFENAFSEFNNSFLTFVNLCRAGNDTEAELIWENNLKISRKNVQNALSDLEKIYTERAKQRSDSNTEEASAASRNMLIYILAGIFIAIGLGIFISRLIARPVKELADAADKLALGDIEVNI
ncbi:MAG: MCP four helix bundle domain-containing protein, partial [Syntrophomonadaceae bacterium]